MAVGRKAGFDTPVDVATKHLAAFKLADSRRVLRNLFKFLSIFDMLDGLVQVFSTLKRKTGGYASFLCHASDDPSPRTISAAECLSVSNEVHPTLRS